MFPVLFAVKVGWDVPTKFPEDVIGEQNFCESDIYISKLVFIFEICFAIFQNDCRMQQIHGRIRRFCSSFKDGYSTSFGAFPHEE